MKGIKSWSILIHQMMIHYQKTWIKYVNYLYRLGNTYGNNNYRDENYHDYMNADALSAPSAHTPLYQSGMGQSQQPPFNSQSQDHSSGQDQRLLSVSGKKKCSHCSEELGTLLFCVCIVLMIYLVDIDMYSINYVPEYNNVYFCYYCNYDLVKFTSGQDVLSIWVFNQFVLILIGRGAAMIIESLRLFYHIPCFKCCVCGIQLGNGSAGADVRVRNHKLHCHNCYSNDEGLCGQFL